VSLGTVLRTRDRPGDDAAHQDDRGARRFSGRLLQRSGKRGDGDVAAGGKVDMLDVPSVGGVTGRDILTCCELGAAFDGDSVVVVDHDQVAQLLMAAKALASALMPS
jgi:hypothetical protein